MTPNNAHSLEESTRRPRRVASKAALTLMQIGLGVACVIGTFWGVTRFLAGDFEPAGRAQPTFSGASAAGIASGVLAVATQVRATEMPEIKGGVPELMPVRVSTSTATDQPKLSPTVIRNYPAKPISSTQVEVPLISSTAASHDESVSDRRRLHEERVTSNASAPGLNSTPRVPELPPDVPAITSGSFGPSVTSPPPQVGLTSDSAKETVSGVHHQDAEAAKMSAVASAEPANEIDASADGENAATKRTAPTIMSPNRTDAQGKGAAKKPKRVVQSSQAEAAKRTAQSAVQASSSAREPTTRSNAAPKRKPAIAQRTRVAAAPSEPSTPAMPPPAAAEVAEQRVHLLGIPVPTGRKVRECVIEWRC
jgi:hypothetical protein